MGRITSLLLCAILLAGCGSNVASQPRTGTTNITIAMGYFPNIQFAPFYVAQAKGYYRAAGLNVHFQYGIEPDLLRLASIGKVDFVNAGGDEVLAAAAQGEHVRYVMTEYSRFPVALFWLARSGISRPADLRGKTIGVPGLYGATYVGLLAFLQAAGVPRASVTIRSIGFTQAAAVSAGKVDVAVGYAPNDPVPLQQAGQTVDEFDVYRWANLAGAGLAAGNTLISRRPAVVRAFVQATLRGQADTLAHPAAALRNSEQEVPALKAEQRTQSAVLQRVLPFWRAEGGHPLGWIDPHVWSITERALVHFRQIPRTVNPAAYYTERFVTGS